MKERKEGKVPHFKDIWTHVPMPKKFHDLDTISDWVKSIISKVDGVGRKILVVDDEEEVLSSLKEILEHEGFLVETVKNGIEALEKMSRKDFNIVLSDIRMPAMDGIELAEICKNHPQLSRIPIILFSGYYDTFSSCADSFIAKPIESEQLLREIKQIFKKYEFGDAESELISKKNVKNFEIIPIKAGLELNILQNLLNFIWVFRPRTIPLFKINPQSNLSIENVRDLLNLIDQQDTALIVEQSPLLLTLLRSEITYLGGNPRRIFNSLEDVQKHLES
ncbi:MAG: response regulator [Promethearchaeota archaeon]|nr:MAG: response regulator [Candidatus Lokiarchaeota archaeon]